jgi:bifunctional non-homologous end joining protein LigD
MLCEGAERPPEGSEWRYELKLDGYRAIGLKSRRSTQLWSRNQKDFARRFPTVTKGLVDLPQDTVTDGEIVALDENGRRSFGLQPARAADRAFTLSTCSCCGARTCGVGRSKTVAVSFAKS